MYDRSLEAGRKRKAAGIRLLKNGGSMIIEAPSPGSLCHGQRSQEHPVGLQSELQSRVDDAAAVALRHTIQSLSQDFIHKQQRAKPIATLLTLFCLLARL